jgi:hypothetical protein
MVEKAGSEVVFKGDLLICGSKIKISNKVPIPQEDRSALPRMPITAGGLIRYLSLDTTST